MDIYIASDRHGWVMKNEIVRHIKETNRVFSAVDLAPKHENTVDAPCYAFFISHVVTDDPRNLGIIVSKTGNEVLIPLNRNKHTRACLCISKEMAKVSKKELNANIIVLPSDITTIDHPTEIIDTWLKTKYDEHDVDNLRKNMLMDM